MGEQNLCRNSSLLRQKCSIAHGHVQAGPFDNSILTCKITLVLWLMQMGSKYNYPVPCRVGCLCTQLGTGKHASGKAQFHVLVFSILLFVMVNLHHLLEWISLARYKNNSTGPKYITMYVVGYICMGLFCRKIYRYYDHIFINIRDSFTTMLDWHQ